MATLIPDTWLPSSADKADGTESGLSMRENRLRKDRFSFFFSNPRAAGVLSENLARDTLTRSLHTVVVMRPGETIRHGVRVRAHPRLALHYLAGAAHTRQFFFLVGLIGTLVDDELRVIYLRKFRGKFFIAFLVDGLIRR